MDNKTTFEQELSSTGRTGIDKLIEELRETDFYQCFCGGHDRYKGGTLNHSLWVLLAARKTFESRPDRYPGVSDDSLIIVCLLHDIGDIRNKYHHLGNGHGRKAALILREMKAKYGLHITNEEMAAIRFHRGHRIVDNFDKYLAAFDNTPLIRLLKHADHSAAGAMNNVRFGAKLDSPICYREKFIGEFFYNSSAQHWYLDTRPILPDSYPTRHGPVRRESLIGPITAKSVLGVNLYGFSFDIRIHKDSHGRLGVFTTVQPSMGDGDFYRSDRHGFGYKSVVVYYNKYNDRVKTAHYIATENEKGLWSIIKLQRGEPKPNKAYLDFVERSLITKGHPTEKDALYAFRKAHHGIDLNNKVFYERIPIKST